jgi:tetratricopeptide (TPR) repeat protein
MSPQILVRSHSFYLPFADQEVSKDDAYEKSMEAIKKALEIDSNLPEAHANLGMLKFHYEWDWKCAEKAFETAISLNPGLSKPHYDYAFYLTIKGDADKSLLEARKAVELDPLSGLPHHNLGKSLYCSGQFHQALREFRQAHEMMPVSLPNITTLAYTYYAKDMFEEAMDVIIKGLEIFPRHALLLSHMGHIKAQINEKDKTQEILDELLERSEKEYVTPFAITSLYTDPGEMDKAYEYLEMGYEKRDIYFPFFRLAYFSDPQFDAFFKKIGL